MAAITYQFTPLSTDLIESKKPAFALDILGVLLNRQKIPGWKMRPAYICKFLGISLYAVKKALKWLQQNGYACYKRTANRHTNWFFSATPIYSGNPCKPHIIKQVDSQPVIQVDSQPVLEEENNLEKKQQREQELIILQEPVVVFSDENSQGTEQEPMPDSDPIPAPEPIPLQDPEPIPAHEPLQKPVASEKVGLIYPKQLNLDQKKNAKFHIKKAPVEFRQDVLFELLYRYTKAKVYNPIGYIVTLVSVVNAGPVTFAYKLDKAFMATLTKKPDIPIAQKRLEKVDNDKFFSDLINRFGNKAVAAIRGAS